MEKSTGLFSSTPSKPISFASLNLSVRDKSSVIIPSPKAFLRTTLSVAFTFISLAADVIPENDLEASFALEDAEARGVSAVAPAKAAADFKRSEERRVGKECRAGLSRSE